VGGFDDPGVVVGVVVAAFFFLRTGSKIAMLVNTVPSNPVEQSIRRARHAADQKSRRRLVVFGYTERLIAETSVGMDLAKKGAPSAICRFAILAQSSLLIRIMQLQMPKIQGRPQPVPLPAILLRVVLR